MAEERRPADCQLGVQTTHESLRYGCAWTYTVLNKIRYTQAVFGSMPSTPFGSRGGGKPALFPVRTHTHAFIGFLTSLCFLSLLSSSVRQYNLLFVPFHASRSAHGLAPLKYAIAIASELSNEDEYQKLLSLNWSVKSTGACTPECDAACHFQNS